MMTESTILGGSGGVPAAAGPHFLSRMLDVGLIGLGLEWEHRFRPALTKLRHRMRIRAVHSPVGSVTNQIAGEWHCQPVEGIVALMERTDVQAVLILDTAWYGAIPAELACRTGKPAFLAGRLGDWHAASIEIPRLSSDCSTTLMPDFGHRYMPATTRLKELVATALRRPREIVLEVGLAPEGGAVPLSAAEADTSCEPIARALDWCSHVIGTPAIEVRTEATSQGSEVVVTYRKPAAAGGEPAIARLRVHPEKPAAMFWDVEAHCARGVAQLHGADQISWQVQDERREETLCGERTEIEVMLDHFSRRVVGGLIPVPTLDDVRHAFRLAKAAEESRVQQTPITIEPVA